MILFLYLGLYVLALVFITVIIARKETEEDFLIAGRDRSWWQILFSKYASTIGAAWFVAYTAFSYKYGVGVFGLIVGLLIGFLLFALWGVPRIRRISEGKNFFHPG